MTNHPAYANEFYVTLPSNASSMEHFPDNKPEKYQTKLFQPIHLNGKWEVALSEIQYPRTWNTFNEKLQFGYQYIDKLDKAKDFIYHKLDKGHYPSVASLIKRINRTLTEEWIDKIKFTYDPYKRRVNLKLAKNVVMYFNDDKLMRALGFSMSQFNGLFFQSSKDYSKSVEAINPPDLRFGRYALFIYTDISESVFVGDSHVPLLRIVPIEGKDDSVITKTYDKLHYVPLLKNHFDSIEIHITDDMGNFYNFQYGKVIVKLHFRPRKLQYL